MKAQTFLYIKNLVVYARYVYPDTFIPSTHFIANVRVESGTGEVIAQEIQNCLKSRNVDISKVMGFGSDGATAMTGKDKGCTGRLLLKNPMMINYHCLAHKLALVSSQAANNVPYLKEYQETLTGIFYFFKSSSLRHDRLENIQKLLDEATLKIREVHEVRWMSIYKAVETVYYCMDSLITIFSTDKEPKTEGYGKKNRQLRLYINYILVDGYLACHYRKLI